jgi:AraC-like DNA-binding protein
MRRPTASTRGILGPDAIGRVFSLRRTTPAADLEHLIERHWVVRWDLGDRPPHRQEVATHPCVNLVFEPHAAAVFGVRADGRALGYFDHAHFIRDFRAVVGRSPAEYEAQCAALAAA